MRKLFFSTAKLVAVAVAGSSFALASPAAAGDWGGHQSSPVDWAGQTTNLKVTSMQAGDGIASSYNRGIGVFLKGFNESFAEQDMMTDVQNNVFIGDPDCANCENDSTTIKQSLFQRTGGLAVQRSEGGHFASSQARVGSGALGQMSTIVERYSAQAQDK